MVEHQDLATNPKVLTSLREARLAQAYFSRKLNELSNDELYLPSLREAWTRAHIVAHIGYHARATARLVEWAGTGTTQSMYESDAARRAEIELGATLSARALRHLSDHAAVQLDVAWRDLADERWQVQILDDQEVRVPVSAMVWQRTRELWQAAIDLNNGARQRDMPVSRQALLTKHSH